MSETLKVGLDYKQVIRIAIIIIVFLVALSLMSTAFSRLGEDIAQSILYATSNPFIGLFIGLLMTAIIQSSSTSTSMTVAAVASGSISLEGALPIVLGANIGTTLTSTIVALGYITKKSEFARAISAGIVHDVFNVLCVAVLFPLEYYYKILSRLSYALLDAAFGSGTTSGEESIGGLNSLVFDPLSEAIYNWVGNPYVILVISFVLLFGAIKTLSSSLYNHLLGKNQNNVENLLFTTPIRTFSVGTLFTGIIQSSSLSTSLMVPLVATKRVSLQKAFQFILGANLGTTITALIASVSKSEAAIGVAIIHLLFNLIGILIFLPLPSVRNIPIKIASYMGIQTAEYRIIGFLYILFVFFLIPFTLIYFNRA